MHPQFGLRISSISNALLTSVRRPPLFRGKKKLKSENQPVVKDS